MTADDILTVREAAVVLDKSVDATRALMRRGSLKARKIRLGWGSAWVTTTQDCTSYMAWRRSHKQGERRRRPVSGRYLRDL